MTTPDFYGGPDSRCGSDAGFYPDGLTPDAIDALQRDLDRELREQGYPAAQRQRCGARRRRPDNTRASALQRTPPSPPSSCASPLPNAARDGDGTVADDDAGPSASQLAGDAAPLVFTPAQAADLLRVPESWLRRRAARRLVPCTFLGKRLRFSRADLDQIVSDAARPASTEERRAPGTGPGRAPRRGRPRGPVRPSSH